MAANAHDEEIHFEPSRFSEACMKLYSKWERDAASDSWGNSCDALVIVCGVDEEDVIKFHKSSALQVALFNVELSDTLIAFCQEKIVILAASKKAKLAQELADALKPSFKYTVQVLTRDKADKDAANFSSVISAVRASKNGAKVGTLKEKNKGGFAETHLKNSGLETGDITAGIADILTLKSAQQLDAVRQGSTVAAQAVKKYIIEEILNLIDDKKEASMVSIVESVEDKIVNLAKEHKLKESDIEVLTQPILQSGGKYDLKYTAQTLDSALHLPDKGVPAVHIVAVSIRHQFCFCTVARTLLFNATKEHQDNYKLLLEVFEECVAVLKPGVRLCKVYERAASFIKERQPTLLQHFVKELGWGMGYELRDKRLALDEKNRNTAEAGMVFCLRLGFENLKFPSKDIRCQTYSLLISDTIILADDKVEITTLALNKKLSKCSWNVSDEPDEDTKKPDKALDPRTADIILAKLGDSKTRKVSESEEAERRKQFEEKNKKLAQKAIEEQRRLVGLKSENYGAASKAVSQVSGYNSPEDFPSKASGNQITVDEDHRTILVPINGLPVPFHISVVKNVAKLEQAGYSVIRINFVAPMSLSGLDKNLMHLRELSYRSQDSATFSMIHKQISDMKKHFNQHETLQRAQAEIVPQEPLRLNANRGPILQNLRIYPNLQARGKKTEGNLEAHVNGFRFVVKKAPSPDLRHIDFLYRNVKHAFFQPSNKSSTIILLHFRLKNPIMVGKQSTKDLQFYVEYMEEGESLMENRKRSGYDRDEIEDESRHRQMVAELNAQFKKYTDRVSELLPPSDPKDPEGDKIWEWDIPYQELEFRGNPKNSMVELYPTTSCIVHLATKPVCIIDLEQVDMAYYERIQAGNRNFDLCFIFKEFLLPDTKIQEGTCWMRIHSIDMQYYDQVREVLQKSTLPQFHGPVSLKWNDVLKTYRKSFDDITLDGGWKSILGSDDEEDEEEEDDDDKSFSADTAESEDSSEEDSDDSDLSEYSEDDSDDYSDEGLSSEGMDSDEAERWAEEEDKKKSDKYRDQREGSKRERSPDSDDDRPRKKGSASATSKGGGSKHGSKGAASSKGLKARR